MSLNTVYAPILNSAVAKISDIFTDFAADPLFAEKFALAFGTTISAEQFLQVMAVLPEIEVLADGELNGALGAFSAQTGKIYLSAGLVTGDLERLQSVLIEEIGHYLDAQVNSVDSPGDEGAIFAAVVLGQDLSSSRLAQLKTEDDSAIITIDEKVLKVEQSASSSPLINGLGGTAGFGENILNRNDDSSTGFIDVTSVFESGLNFFGTTYNGFYLNNNGNITFTSPLSTYTPFALTGNTGVPIIAAFFTDIDTGAGVLTASSGGNSTGSNLVYWDIDPANNQVILTWDDVGEYSNGRTPNAFQLRLKDLGAGDFSVEFRYEDIQWYRGNARAGYSAANGVNFFELSQSGSSAMLDLELTSNINQAGTYSFFVVNGTPNQQPTNIVLSTTTIDENTSNSTVIGNFSTVDPDVGDTHTYSLVDNAGGRFAIVGNQLTVANSSLLDFEVNSSHNITVTTTDNAGIGFTKDFTIVINDVNETPTDIQLTNSSVNENSQSSTVIGSLNTIDSDTNNTFTYSLVTGAGDTDNGLFSIVGNQLKTNAVFDYETKNSYNIRVRTTDQGGLSYEKQLTIGVINVNENPINLNISNSSIAENQLIATNIGTFTTTDSDTNNTFTYGLVTGAGDTDNSLFSIVGNQLKTNAVFDYETKNSYNIRVRTTDQGGLSYEKQLTIGVINVNEGSLSFSSPQFSIGEDGTPINIVTVIRSQGSDGAVSVTLASSNGTATAPSDYNNTPITVNFADGETSKNVTIPIVDDNLFEGDETLNLTLVNPTSGANLGTQTTAVLTIVDNDNVPDLIVSNITAPVEVISGQPLEISWTVKNQGVTAATGTWYDYVYLQNQNGGQNYNIGTFEFVGSLAVGESIDRSQTITLPILLQGDYKVVVTTDYSNYIPEGIQNESNNTTTDDRLLQVKLAPIPNLQVSSVTAPLTAFSSQSTAIQWTVKNVGNGATSSPYWSDFVYFSLDNTFDDTDIYLGQANNPSYLNAGDSYTNHLDVTLPRGISGNYYFLVQTDIYNSVFENDKENDNLTVGGPTNVSLTPPPDFQVTNVTTPSQAFSGQSLNLSWTVTNQGLGKNLESYWYDQVFMSTDEVLDTGDRNLGTFYQNGILNGNDSYTSSQTVFLPIGISGDYYFFVRTDAGNQVYENVFDGNNTGNKATPTRINLTPPPDLEIAALTAPTQATASRALNFSYQVTNFGSTTTPNYYWADRFFLSLDNQLDLNTDLHIGDQYHYGSLAPDESYTNNFSYTLPNTLTGNYYLFGITDSNNEVFELNNDNNTFLATTPIAITSQPADLIVVSVSAPTTGEAGKALRVEWTVRNQGTGDTAVSGWTDRVILSQDDQVGNGDDLVLGSFSRGEILAPNQSYTRSELVTIPFDAIAVYQVFVVTDAGNSVYEATQENNNNSTGQPLTVTRDTADLQVTQVSSPSSGQSGQALTVNWTVKNFGNSTTNSNYWYDGVYLSTDNQISNDDIFLGYAYRSEALDASEQYSVSRSFNLPNNLQAGNYYTLVRTDALSYVYEGSLENNNDKATQGTTAGTGGETTGGTSLGVTASPDLVMVSVDAPTTGVGGQNLTVNWTVRNAGTVETGDRSWYEAFYLSRDQVFDRSSDTYLGYSYHTGNLAAGATYSKTESFRLPQGISGPFYLFAETDAGNWLYEGTAENNNVIYDANSVAVSLAQPADLVVGTITIPANGVTGQNASITYTVTNEGSNAVVGNWSDSLYLSKDGQWDINDLFLGQAENSGEVLSGDSYTNTVTGSLPGVVPGDYQVIIRSDIRNQIPESNESNNLKATLDKVNVDVERLTLGTPSTGTLAQGQGVYYRFEVGAGETLRLKLDSVSTEAANELYLRYGEMPTRSAFDLGFSEALSADQEIVIPETQAGTYYVLAYGQTVAESTPSFSIEAKILDFEIRSLSTKTGGNAGKVTVEILGAKFDGETIFTLVDNALGTKIAASRVDLIDSTKLFVTFDLKGNKAGVYDVVAKNRNNQVSTLQNGFTVVEGGKANLVTEIIAPSAVRPGVVIPITIQFANNGNIDMDNPLALLSSETQAPIALTREDLFNQTSLELLLQSDDSPFGVLAPGATGSITFYAEALPSLSSLNFSLSVLDDPTTALKWDSYIKTVESQFPELFTNPSLTENFWKIFRETVGETVGDIQNNLLNLQQFSLEAAKREAQVSGVPFSEKDYPTFSLNDLYSIASLVASYGADQPIDNAPTNNVNSLSLTENKLSSLSINSSEVTPFNETLLLDPALQFQPIESQGVISLNSSQTTSGNCHTTLQDKHPLFGGYEDGTEVYFNVWKDGKRLEEGTINPLNKTYIIIHGFQNTGGNPDSDPKKNYVPTKWMATMANALKQREPDSNVILVDWENGASWWGVNNQAYASAAKTTQFLGDAVGQYIIDKGYASSKVTLIGHSLGAQTAGAAGEYLKQQGQTLGKIIALDAAAPDFEQNPRKNNNIVDSTDATKVIAIHTSLGNFNGVLTLASGFGFVRPFAHQDLYINPRRDLLGNLVAYGQPRETYTGLDKIAPIGDHGYAYKLLNRLLEGGNIFDPNSRKSLNWDTLETLSLYSDEIISTTGKVWDFQEKKIGVILSSNTIRENSFNGIPVGEFSIYDKRFNDDGYKYEFSLVENAGGRFGISGNQLVVANGSLLDYEAGSGSYQIEVKTTAKLVSDPENNNSPVIIPTFVYDESEFFTIRLLDVDENDPNDSGGSGGGSGGSGGGSTSSFPKKFPPDNNTTIPFVTSSDPNDIIGPTGFGEEKWTSASSTLPYTIRFENISTATAPAQTVTVTHPLDTDLDFRTFRLGSFGWGGLIFDVPANTAFYNQRLDLTATRGYFVDVTAGIDLVKGEAFWTVTTIDPNTGEVPADALTGFLPPNNTDGIGDGFVNYTIKAKRDVTTGTVIDAKATIVFDTEAPIDTPPIFNTLDAGKPTSTVNTLPTNVTNPEFVVNWTGNDDSNGSALANYTVYVSDNNGEFTPWLTDTTLTEATYIGQTGHTYAFYSIAKDNAGNTQTLPDTAQATIIVGTLNTAPTITSGLTANFAENSTGIAYTVTATDAEGTTPTYGLLDSDADASLFNINSTTGAITFKTAPDFETPLDNGADNTYNLTVTANDGSLTSSKAVALTVNDLNEIKGDPLINNGRNPIVGTAGPDYLTGGAGAKTLTGGGGNDSFVFTNMRDVGQRIADFTVGEDKLVFTQLFSSLSYTGSNPVTDGYIKFVQGTGANSAHTFLQIDRDGLTGSAIARNFLQVDNITPTLLNNPNNFQF